MSRMEMIYIDSTDQGRQTGVGAVFDTPAETWRAFNSARRLAVPSDKATFLLDYYNRKGELANTICLSRSGFEKITGEKAKSDAAYRKLDRKYWADARQAMEAKP